MDLQNVQKNAKNILKDEDLYILRLTKKDL